MSYHDHAPREQPQRDKSLFAILETIIDEGDARPIENALGIGEVQPVLGEIAAVLV